MPGAANPQAWNRYSYVLGNPLKYVDPTGHGQCQTQEDCADMGTTPMGTGGSGGGSTGGNGGGGGDPHDDDDADPNPDCIGCDDGPNNPIVSYVPPGPACIVTGNSCVNNNPDILQYFPTLLLHPSDLNAIHGHLPITVLPLYSSDGKIIGYRVVYYRLENFSFNKDASGLISDFDGIIAGGLTWALNEGTKKALGYAICSGCGEVAAAVTVGDFTNQAVTYTFTPQVSVVLLAPADVQPVDMHYYIGPP